PPDYRNSPTCCLDAIEYGRLEPGASQSSYRETQRSCFQAAIVLSTKRAAIFRSRMIGSQKTLYFPLMDEVRNLSPRSALVYNRTQDSPETKWIFLSCWQCSSAARLSISSCRAAPWPKWCCSSCSSSALFPGPSFFPSGAC